MTHILAIRPEPGLTSTIISARALGLAVTGTPLFEVRPLDWEAPDPAQIDALLIGSANAIRHGGVNLAHFLDKPVHAVGKSTEKTARQAGFQIGSVGSGGLQNVLDALHAPLRLLRIAGADHVPLDPPKGVNIHKVIAYKSVALPLEPAVMDHDGNRSIVLLHSAAAAEHFANECNRLGFDKGRIELAVLGPRIASAAGKDWRAIHVSERPDDAALLAMVDRLCQ
ncbi:uroporphyrinogen-III synthase [Erythrobacter insulae]|uniref:Uroporphyrinogen-III synthase n=1 Tax=Erythrobacter insulae TaxID=2584124 RepID=A0A547PDD7_9SPHN|nr:uroporphyrinogen-III synthase [Erythrobacter insulae]TRD12148.1 uroporphyrinogen-III synthase [Erythrobacter insulae]